MVDPGSEDTFRINKRTVRRVAATLVILLVATAAYGLGRLTSSGARQAGLTTSDRSARTTTTSGVRYATTTTILNTVGTSEKHTGVTGSTSGDHYYCSEAGNHAGSARNDDHGFTTTDDEHSSSARGVAVSIGRRSRRSAAHSSPDRY